jgi:tetratricopeptide (TPR) repeat protein
MICGHKFGVIMEAWKSQIVSATILFFSCIAPAMANDPYQDGMDAFNAKRYHAAEDLFMQAAARSPSDPHIFMQLGRTREMLLDRDGAKEAYEGAFKINPFGAEGRTAKEALINLSATIEGKKHAPMDSAEVMRQSANTIQAQGRELSGRAINESDAMANSRRRLGRIGRNNARFLRWGAEVSDPFGIGRQQRRMDDATQATLYRAFGRTRATGAQQSANNLVGLLAEHGYSSSPHLRALGTNLYVRNYASPEDDEQPPQDPVEQMHAVQQRLSDLPVEMRARQAKLTP